MAGWWQILGPTSTRGARGITGGRSAKISVAVGGSKAFVTPRIAWQTRGPQNELGKPSRDIVDTLFLARPSRAWTQALVRHGVPPAQLRALDKWPLAHTPIAAALLSTRLVKMPSCFRPTLGLLCELPGCPFDSFLREPSPGVVTCVEARTAFVLMASLAAMHRSSVSTIPALHR